MNILELPLKSIDFYFINYTVKIESNFNKDISKKISYSDGSIRYDVLKMTAYIESNIKNINKSLIDLEFAFYKNKKIMDLKIFNQTKINYVKEIL